MTKLWEILARQADPDWQPAPRIDWGAGAFTGAAEFRAHSSAVSMWKEPQAPVDGLAVLAERRAKLALGKAQEALHRAIARADRPLPCRQPGPDPVSEDRAERQQAAERCGSCPVVTECGAVGAAMPLESWGVFGGHDYGGDAEDLAELKTIGAQTFAGQGGAPARTRRDELFRALQDRWSVAELAAAAQTSDSTVRTALGYKRKPQTRRAGRPSDLATRRARHELELAWRADDPRVKRLRELAGLPGDLRDPELIAERRELLAALWAECPRYWTTERLAVAAGLRSSSYVRRILGTGGVAG